MAVVFTAAIGISRVETIKGDRLNYQHVSKEQE